MNRETEQRKEKRFIEQNDVLIRDERLVLDAAADGVIYGLTRDLSLSGTRIISQQVFPVGCVWRMIIDLKRTHELLRVDGRVKWVKKSKNAELFHIGVEFVHCYPDTTRLLIKHLYSRQGEDPAPIS
ncbi:MAG TPA: PilZ domain-containing protein [Acidobacteriota bacterium]|nr:PilZ domain-containing protein [Acidobacteriota bacterium]